MEQTLVGHKQCSSIARDPSDLFSDVRVQVLTFCVQESFAKLAGLQELHKNNPHTKGIYYSLYLITACIILVETCISAILHGVIGSLPKLIGGGC